MDIINITNISSTSSMSNMSLLRSKRKLSDDYIQRKKVDKNTLKRTKIDNIINIIGKDYENLFFDKLILIFAEVKESKGILEKYINNNIDNPNAILLQMSKINKFVLKLSKCIKTIFQILLNQFKSLKLSIKTTLLDECESKTIHLNEINVNLSDLSILLFKMHLIQYFKFLFNFWKNCKYYFFRKDNGLIDIFEKVMISSPRECDVDYYNFIQDLKDRLNSISSNLNCLMGKMLND
jgi:hypothetical protein